MGLLSSTMLFTYIIRAIVMLIAIPVHEAAHAFVSYKLGDDTAKRYGRMTLNPIPHMDLWGTLCMIFVGIGWAKPVPTNAARFKNPKQGMALTAAAGPAANILVAFLSILLYKVVFYFAPQAAATEFILVLLQYLASIDIVLAVFNLLPVPPFDGSRIALVLLPQRLYFSVMKYERYIMMGMFLLLILGVLDLPLYFLQNKLWDFLLWSTSFVDKFVEWIYMTQMGVSL